MAFGFTVAPLYTTVVAAPAHTTTGIASVTGSTFLAIVFSFIGSPNGAAPSSVSDNKGNTYTLVRTQGPVELARTLSAYVCANGIGGAGHAFTANFSPNNAIATVFFIEITGAGAADLATDASGINNTGDPRTIASAAAITSGSLVVFAGTSSFGADPSFVMNDGSTIRQQNNNGANGWCAFVSTREAASTAVHTGSANMLASDAELIIFGIDAAAAGSGGSAVVVTLQ